MQAKPLLDFLGRDALLQIRELALTYYKDKTIYKNEQDDAHAARAWVEAFANFMLQEKNELLVYKDKAILCHLIPDSK